MGKIRVSHYRIRRREGMETSTTPVRIAVLADMHNSVYRSSVPALIRAISREGCDLVLSAGDLVCGKKDHYETDQVVWLMSSLAKKLPVYAANGNHEMKMRRCFPGELRKYEDTLEKAGVIFVHNRSRDVTINGMDLTITGLELDYRYFRNRYHKDLSVEEMEKLVGRCTNDRFHILLAHHPKYFPVYAGWGADLTLSGHLHGGIVQLPLLGGVISPDPELFPKYDRGLFEEETSRMIVSAGLGSHSINFRINNPAELVIADII